MSYQQKKLDSLLVGRHTLDIGCGRNKRAGAVGLDYMPLPGVDVVADLANRLPFDDETFDAVIANQVLEHINDLVALVREVHRVLRTGGVFVVHVPYFRSAWAHIDPTHVRSFTISSLDYFVRDTYCYDNYRFMNESFSDIQVFLDIDYRDSLLRQFFSSIAVKKPFRYENSIWSTLYPFEQITYLLTK